MKPARTTYILPAMLLALAPIMAFSVILASVAPITRFETVRGFTITAYCPGHCCNGPWAGLTASGEPMARYLRLGVGIAAVDPAVIPLGSRISYQKRVYLAVDVGTKIRGKRIDLLFPTHPQTEVFGVKRDQAVGVHLSKQKIHHGKKG